jgi:hypothetical protein
VAGSGAAVKFDGDTARPVMEWFTVVGCSGENAISARQNGATIEFSNLYNNSAAEGVLWTDGWGMKVNYCVFFNNSRDISAHESRWSGPFVVCGCVFGDSVPTDGYISGTGNIGKTVTESYGISHFGTFHCPTASVETRSAVASVSDGFLMTQCRESVESRPSTVVQPSGAAGLSIGLTGSMAVRPSNDFKKSGVVQPSDGFKRSAVAGRSDGRQRSGAAWPSGGLTSSVLVRLSDDLKDSGLLRGSDGLRSSSALRDSNIFISSAVARRSEGISNSGPGERTAPRASSPTVPYFSVRLADSHGNFQSPCFGGSPVDEDTSIRPARSQLLTSPTPLVGLDLSDTWVPVPVHSSDNREDSPDGADSSQGGGLSVGLGVGLGVPAIVVIAVLVALIVARIRRRPASEDAHLTTVTTSLLAEEHRYATSENAISCTLDDGEDEPFDTDIGVHDLI